jgi:hypothetical protein
VAWRIGRGILTIQLIHAQINELRYWWRNFEVPHRFVKMVVVLKATMAWLGIRNWNGFQFITRLSRWKMPCLHVSQRRFALPTCCGCFILAIEVCYLLLYCGWTWFRWGAKLLTNSTNGTRRNLMMFIQ